MRRADERILIDIPSDGSYIEILGHRIDDHGGWDKFMEYLDKCAGLEEENRKLRNIIDDFGPGPESVDIINDDGEPVSLIEIVSQNKKLKEENYKLDCRWAQLIRYLTNYKVKKLHEIYGDYDDLKTAETKKRRCTDDIASLCRLMTFWIR